MSTPTIRSHPMVAARLARIEARQAQFATRLTGISQKLDAAMRGLGVRGTTAKTVSDTRALRAKLRAMKAKLPLRIGKPGDDSSERMDGSESGSRSGGTPRRKRRPFVP